MTTLAAGGTAELERELDTNGYAVLRDVVSGTPLTAFAEEVQAAYNRMERFPGGGSITGHLNCYPGRSARFLYDELTERGVIDAVLTIRAGRPNAMRATMNFNLPGSVAQHYHTDGLYVDDFLICNIAVIDTDVMNGAIDVLPGTNREFIPFWKYAVRRLHKLSTRVEMRQGDVLLRKSTLWHRGMPNRSSAPRPMLSLTFGERSAPGGAPPEAFESDIRFYPNWYSTSRMGVLRERTFAKAPLSYSAYRFAKSLHGAHGYSSY